MVLRRERMLVIAFCSGIAFSVVADSRTPLTDLITYSHSFAYSTVNPYLKEGFSFSYQKLANIPVHI
jgi:hypothetical protein